jgi:soluble lytic murein transglycosylase
LTIAAGVERSLGVQVSFRAAVLSVSSGIWWLAVACAASSHAAAAREDALRAADRPIYKQAFTLAGQSDYAAARTTAMQGRQPLLNKFFIWLDLIHQKDGDPQSEPFSALDAFLSANGSWPSLNAIQRRAEQRLPDEFSDEQVIVWFGQRKPLTVSGAMRLASALRSVGGTSAATDLVRRTWRTLSFTEREEAIFLALFGGELRTSDEIARFDRLLTQRELSAAKRQAKRMGRGYPRLAKAVLRLILDRPGVDAAIAQVPPELQDDSVLLYERARWRQRRGRYEGVVELLDRAANSVRWPERWWPIRHWAAREALDRGEAALAYRLASDHGLKDGRPTNTSCGFTTVSRPRSAEPAAPIGPPRPPSAWAIASLPKAGMPGPPTTRPPSMVNKPSPGSAGRSISTWSPRSRSPNRTAAHSKPWNWSVWCASSPSSTNGGT